MSQHYRPEDALVPPLLYLLSIVYSQVLHYVSWRDLQGLDELVLEDKHAASDQVDLEYHLVGHAVNILWVYFQ